MTETVLESIYKDIVKSTFMDLLERHRRATLEWRDAELNVAAESGLSVVIDDDKFVPEAFARCIISEITRWADYDMPLDEEEVSLWEGLEALARWYTGKSLGLDSWHTYAGEQARRHALLSDIKDFVHEWLDNLEEAFEDIQVSTA